MGFLSFRKKSKTSKALNTQSSPPPLVLNDEIYRTTTDAGSDYHSPIADSFMMVGSSIVDMAQSSLSEDIFKELIPLSNKSQSSTESKDTIRHSLTLKSNSNSVKSSISPLRINTAIHVHTDSIQSPLNESIISNTTRSSKQSDSSDSSLASLSSIEEFVPLHPISRSDPSQYVNKKLGEHAPLIDLVNRSPPHEHAVTHTTSSVTATSVPGLAMARMKERHRQEYRRSMQWSPPTQLLPHVPTSAAMMDCHHSSSKRASSLISQRTHPMQHQLPPPSVPSLAPRLVHSRAQVPLISQIKPVVIPRNSISSTTHTSKSFDRKPLIASIPSPVSYQQSKQAMVHVPDHRHFYVLNQAHQHPPSTVAMQYQAEIVGTTNQNRCPRQRLAGITEHHYQQQQQQQQPQLQEVELSKSSKLRTDYRRIVYTRKQDYVPDLVDLLDRQDEQQPHQVDEKLSSSHCSHHQLHHTMIKRQYNNMDGCQQLKQQQHQYPNNTHRCNHHHHHYTHCHHRKPATCCNTCC
ncbi:hypothetical protein MAM1_0006c00790 [Mucor ambiguus]|uniref:Uncharacterized protein n=1 Tax=Mucor ambiguus TaxID=91626 RepID=A0A0C9MED9_9FUNG|nr:hypothetical protein MAM1_0006c00790 [Mucor ambiguus]